MLLLDYLIGAKRRRGPCRRTRVALKSLVTTQLAQVVAEANGVRCYNTFTGFKFMAEKKTSWEAAGQGHVIFSYEESIGYMIGVSRPGQGRGYRRLLPHGDDRLVRRPGHDPAGRSPGHL